MLEGATVQIAVGLALLVAGVFLRPWLERLIPPPGRMRRVETEIARIEADHKGFEARNRDEMEAAVRVVGEDFASRGVFDSGGRIAAEVGISKAYGERLADHETDADRRKADAIAGLNRIERSRLTRRRERATNHVMAILARDEKKPTGALGRWRKKRRDRRLAKLVAQVFAK